MVGWSGVLLDRGVVKAKRVLVVVAGDENLEGERRSCEDIVDAILDAIVVWCGDLNDRWSVVFNAVDVCFSRSIIINQMFLARTERVESELWGTVSSKSQIFN